MTSFILEFDPILDRETVKREGGENTWQESWVKKAFLGSSRDG